MDAPAASVICTGMICLTLIALALIAKVRVKTTTDVEVG